MFNKYNSIIRSVYGNTKHNILVIKNANNYFIIKQYKNQEIYIVYLVAL